jgi:hypothetical protein
LAYINRIKIDTRYTQIVSAIIVLIFTLFIGWMMVYFDKDFTYPLSAKGEERVDNPDGYREMSG